MTRRGKLPDDLGTTFSVSDARNLGVSRSRLRSVDLDSPFRGVRQHSEDAPVEHFARQRHELLRLCRAFDTVAPEGYAYSHQTAALLLGIAVPTRLRGLDVLHVTVPPGHQPRRRGVVTHRLTEPARKSIDGLPVLPPERVWVQLGSSLTVDESVIAGDCLVRRKGPMSTLDRMTDALGQAAGRRGVGVSRAALPLIRPGTDSPPESELRLVLVRAGLPEPVIRHTVTHNGSWVGTPDLAYVRHRVALEYQGEGHRTHEVFEDDVERIERFREAGWTVIQITRRQLRHPAGIIAKVRRALLESGARV